MNINFEIPWKIVCTTPDGRQFIRYRNQSYTLMIEVFTFDDINLLTHTAGQFEDWAQHHQLPPVHTNITHGPHMYLLILSEVHYHRGSEKTLNHLQQRIQRIAKWFLHDYLFQPETPNPIQQTPKNWNFL